MLLVTVVVVALFVSARRRAEREGGKRLKYRGERAQLLAKHDSQVFAEVMDAVDQIDPTEIDLGKRIGRGSFGEVFKARWRGTDIALKKLPKHMVADPKFLEDFASEILIMSKLRHPNVLQFLGVSVRRQRLGATLERRVEALPAAGEGAQ